MHSLDDGLTNGGAIRNSLRTRVLPTAVEGAREGEREGRKEGRRMAARSKWVFPSLTQQSERGRETTAIEATAALALVRAVVGVLV